jgi:hypothetical protein
VIIFQRAKLSMRSNTHLCWSNCRTFWRENATGRSPRRSCSCTTMPQLTEHLQPRRIWPTWASKVLITYPIHRIWPRWTTTFPWTEKTTERSPFIVQRRGHYYCRDMVEWTTYEFFLNGLQKLEQRAKKCIVLHGEYVE